MWVNVIVIVCDFVYKYKSVCLSAFVKGIHVYLLLSKCCDTRRLCVVVSNKPSRLGVHFL